MDLTIKQYCSTKIFIRYINDCECYLLGNFYNEAECAALRSVDCIDYTNFMYICLFYNY